MDVLHLSSALCALHQSLCYSRPMSVLTEETPHSLLKLTDFFGTLFMYNAVFLCISLYFSELNFCHRSCVGNGCRKTFGTVREHTPPRQMEEYAKVFRTLHKIVFKIQQTVIISKLSI